MSDRADTSAVVSGVFPIGKTPETTALVSALSDKDIWRLNRGGHDPHKVYAAYDQASKNVGRPTVIIAKTIKGYGMGKTGESVNTTHQQKKMGVDDLMYYRDRFDVPLMAHQTGLYNTSDHLHPFFSVGV